MGAAASTIDLATLTAVQVGEIVAGIGEQYKPYADTFVSNGVSGDILVSMTNEDDINSLLADLQITKPLHQRVLRTNLEKFMHSTEHSSEVHSHAPHATIANSQESSKPWNIDNFKLNEVVTTSPRTIMSRLFEIQGIKLDPSDLEPAIAKIVKVVGKGYGNGIDKFDCFINYRVAADADIAEMVYLYLKTEGVHAYLDKKCLKDAMKWKEGFLTGLTSSKCFVALISRAGLTQVRNFATDHTYDNVLLEYETALNVMAATANPKFICPILVGALAGAGNLVKFTDFNPALYADQIGAVLEPSEEARIAVGVTSSVTPATPIEVIEISAPVVKFAKEELADEESSDHGNNDIDESDPQPEQPEVDPYEGITFLDQPGGTSSRYNSSYYCDILEVGVDQTKLVVGFNVRGDGSLGSLQDPMTSKISIGNWQVHASRCKTKIKNIYQIAGELEFDVDVEDSSIGVLSSSVYFTFGQSGYSSALLQIPGAENIVEIPNPVIVTCHEHPLVVATGEGYGWACDGMNLPGGCKSGCTGFYQTTGWDRYRCPSGCNYDLCRLCILSYMSEDQNQSYEHLHLPELSSVVHVNTHSHPLTINKNDNGWACDGRKEAEGCKSGCTGFRQSYGWKRYRCNACDFDYCENCARANLIG